MQKTRLDPKIFFYFDPLGGYGYKNYYRFYDWVPQRTWYYQAEWNNGYAYDEGSETVP